MGRSFSFLDDSSVIAVSGCNDGEVLQGGLLLLTRDETHLVDQLATTGIYYDANTDIFLRTLHAPHGPNAPCELLIYKENNLLHKRIDEIQDPHSIIATNQGYAISSTFTNEVCYFNENALVTKVISLSDADYDCLHLNSLMFHDNLYATVFSLGTQHAPWRNSNQNAGALVNVEDFNCVIKGLTTPHHPIIYENRIILCESKKSLVSSFNFDRKLIGQISLNEFTRGLCAADKFLLVGESIDRSNTERHRGKIKLISDDLSKVIDEIEIPFKEIYDICIIPEHIANRIVAFTNAVKRLEETGVLKRWWKAPEDNTIEPVSPENISISYSAKFPESVNADKLFPVEIAITNTSNSAFAHYGKFRLNLSYKWIPELEKTEPLRTPIFNTFYPNQTLNMKVLVRAPKQSGVYELLLTAVQENVCWLDELANIDLPRKLIEVI